MCLKLHLVKMKMMKGRQQTLKLFYLTLTYVCFTKCILKFVLADLQLP